MFRHDITQRFTAAAGHQRCEQLVKPSGIAGINSVVLQAEGGIKKIYIILHVLIHFLPGTISQHIVKRMIGSELPRKDFVG